MLLGLELYFQTVIIQTINFTRPLRDSPMRTICTILLARPFGADKLKLQTCGKDPHSVLQHKNIQRVQSAVNRIMKVAAVKEA